jgi:hypothetical protein
MNVFRFLVPQEKISGLHISAEALRLAYVRAAGRGAQVVATSQAALPPGTLADGVLKDRPAFTAAAASLLKAARPAPLTFPYVIVALPAAVTYSQCLVFPPIPPERLDEAVSANAALTLPLPLTDAYLDWHVIEGTATRTVVVVSLAPKAVVDGYAAALKDAGFELVAMESPAQSLGRAVKRPASGMTLLVADDGQSEVLSAIYNDQGVPLFCRRSSWVELGLTAGSPSADPARDSASNVADPAALGQAFGREIRRLYDYASAEHPALTWQGALVLSPRPEANEAVLAAASESGLTVTPADTLVAGVPWYDWLTAAGAGVRGLLPRSDDTFNSVLPVGTEALYEQQQALSFLRTIRAASLAVLAVYVAAYLGALLFLVRARADVERQLAAQARLPAAPAAAALEAEARSFNAQVAALGAIPTPSGRARARLVRDALALAGPGITFLHLTVPSGATPTVSVTGAAQTRERLVSFRQQLAAEPQLSAVRLQAANLALKENVPFTLTFTYQTP